MKSNTLPESGSTQSNKSDVLPEHQREEVVKEEATSNMQIGSPQPDGADGISAKSGANTEASSFCNHSCPKFLSADLKRMPSCLFYDQFGSVNMHVEMMDTLVVLVYAK